MDVKLTWDGMMGFEGLGGLGTKTKIDIAKENGGRGQGPSPMELVLMGLGGCAGLDIVSILSKAQASLEEFTVEISGERAKEHPRKFTKIFLKFYLKGRGLTEANVSRAVKLSMDKYCSVRHSLNSEVIAEYLIDLVE